MRVSDSPAVLIASLGLLACVVLAQPAPDAGRENSVASPAWVEALAVRVPGLAERLNALEPGDAEAAFLLGEEIAGVSLVPESTSLARAVYLHAYAWADSPDTRITSMPRRRLRGAIVLGLADLETESARGEWLTVVAHAIDPELGRRDWTRPVGRTSIDGARFDAASAVGFIRSGWSDRAERLLESPGVRDILAAEGSVLFGIAGSGDAVELIEREIDLWPCPRCQNARIVGHETTGQARLCPVCRGDPGPELSAAERVGWLSLESRLLRETQRGWAAQLASDLGRPLREPEPDDLLPMYDYDPAKTVWNGSAFVEEAEPGSDVSPDGPASAPGG